MANPVKLSDIAEAMGVSSVTVSKALSDQKGVSEELRAKIKKMADEMGYVKPFAERKIRSDKSYNIGVLMSEKYLSKYDSFYWQLYQEVSKSAALKSCFIFIEVVSVADEDTVTMPKLIRERKADGVIVIGKLAKAYLAGLEEQDVPCVYLDFYEAAQKNADAVISNSYYGTYLLTDYLYQCGHRKIAFVGTTVATKSIMDRYMGYCKALAEHRLAIRSDYIVDDRTEDNSRMVEENEIRLPEDMPTAFVCNCDLTAGYMIKKLEKEGYHVPEDISVVGFDNYLYPGICDVGITTYDVDMAEMARKAISTIKKKISKAGYKSGIVLVEGRIIYRDSVKEIPF